MPEPDAIGNAWRIHDSIRDWTGKVDSKASFALTIDSALLVAVLALASGHRRLANLDGAALGFFVAGVVGVILAALLSARAVRPQIREAKVSRDWPDNFIFFGHLKFWEQDGLHAALLERDILPVLSRQLIVMSQIAWKKHRWLQWSMNFLIAGAACLGIAAAIN